MSELILADTSVWVRHFRNGEEHLIELLDQGLIACHPFIVGELACGSLKNRQEIIQLLEALPRVNTLDHSEVLWLIESRNLMSQGIGYVDTHLLGAALVSNTPLWTLDKSLQNLAEQLNISHSTQ